MAEDRNQAADVEENIADAAQDVTEETREGQTEESSEESAVQEQQVDDDAEAGEPEEAKEPTQGEKIKKFFAKKKDAKDEKIEELTDQLKRQMAEFDNYRKRTDKEKAGMYIVGAKEIVEKLLPVVDSFERGLSTATEEQMEDPFVDGMNKVYKQMLTALDELGVKPIEAVGCEFNPDFHNAVMHVEDESFGENVIAEELQKGYMYRDTVVRHSMVKVAN